ncbi:major facilitator superfamily domain-containing protein 6-B-like isoform X2 [Panulirus ornatus]
MLPLMVRQKGVSAQVLGVLWTVLPMVGLITNSISGTLADYLRAHRTVFLGSITALTMGISFIYWIPELSVAQVVPPHPTQNLTTLGNATSHLNLTAEVNHIKQSLKSSGSDDDYTFLIDQEMIVAEGQALPSNPKVLLGLEAAPQEDASFADLVYNPTFWLIFFSLMIEQMGISTCVTITDAVCFQILGSERHKFGQQRLWGTIGMGFTAICSGALVDLYSRGLPQKDYLPSVITSLVLMSLDFVVVARLKIPNTKGKRVRLGDVGSTLAQPETLVFLLTVFMMGVSLGMMWVFKLMLVEDVAMAWDPQFSALKILQGLNMAIENFGGEVPFLFLSGMIIQRLGPTSVLAISLATISLQMCLYSFVTNPWLFLPIEFLNGPTHSLFYTVMVSHASSIAPPGAQATVQSIVKSCFSLGSSTAGFLGGTLFHHLGGSRTFLAIGLFDIAYGIVFGLLHFLIWEFSSPKRILGDTGYVATSTVSSGHDDTTADQAPDPAREALYEDV